MLTPNVVSFSASISACEKGKHWEEALCILNKMLKIIITTKQENKLSKKIPPNYFKTIESLIEIEVEAEKIAEERYKKSPKKNPPLLKLLKSKNKPKED